MKKELIIIFGFSIKIILFYKQFEIFNLEVKFKDTNPCVFIMKLILGIILTVVSILWVVHM